jgi:hypothetical protein
MYDKNHLLNDNSTPINSQYCSSQLEISISARNLLNRDLISKSDPQCVVYQFDGSQYHQICKTEVIHGMTQEKHSTNFAHILRIFPVIKLINSYIIYTYI